MEDDDIYEILKAWHWCPDFEKGVVKGYAHTKDADDEEPWFCRVSEHTTEEITFDEMWFGADVAVAPRELAGVDVCSGADTGAAETAPGQAQPP